MPLTRKAILMATVSTVAMVKWLVVQEFYDRPTNVEEVVVALENSDAR